MKDLGLVSIITPSYNCSKYVSDTIEAIKDGAYIGMRANITARHDIVIGEGAIIGASTLVNKSVPDGAICVGVPGRIIEKKQL